MMIRCHLAFFFMSFFPSFLYKTQDDRIDSKRRSRVGTIEVVRCEASYVKEEYRPTKDTSFNQANKKDTYRVTEGKYTMSTTKKGRYLHRTIPYQVQLKKMWRIGRECGRLVVNYRMGHTLQDMGISLRETDWSRIVVRRSGSSPTPSNAATPENSPSPSSSPKYSMEDQEDVKPDIATLQLQVVNW